MVFIRRLLNDNTQKNIQKLKQSKENLINQVTQIEIPLVIHHPTFGFDDKQQAIQPNEMSEYNRALGAYKATFIKDEIAETSIFSFDYLKYITFLTNKEKEINDSLYSKTESLNNLTVKEKELKSHISELKARKVLSSKILEVEAAIKNHKILSALNSNSNAFNTYSISQKTTQAREALVEKNFEQLFEDELKSLRKSHIKINLNLKTSK